VKTPLGISTWIASPKYRTREDPLKSTRKEPVTLKNGLSLSTVIVLMPEQLSAKPLIWETLAGMQIDWSDEQLKKAELPIVESTKLTALNRVRTQNYEDIYNRRNRNRNYFN
jgi:hypothetical protein